MEFGAHLTFCQAHDKQTVFVLLAPRQRGEGWGEGNQVECGRPPLPGPLLHKPVEEREIRNLFKN